MPPKAKTEKLDIGTTEVEDPKTEEATTEDAVEEPSAEPETVEVVEEETEEAPPSGTLSVKIAVVEAPGEDPTEVDQELAQLAASGNEAANNVNYVKNDQGIQFRLGNSWTFCTTAQVKAYEVYGSALAQQFIRVPISELPESLQGVATNSAEAGHVWVLVQPDR